MENLINSNDTVVLNSYKDSNIAAIEKKSYVNMFEEIIKYGIREF